MPAGKRSLNGNRCACLLLCLNFTGERGDIPGNIFVKIYFDRRDFVKFLTSFDCIKYARGPLRSASELYEPCSQFNCFSSPGGDLWPRVLKHVVSFEFEMHLKILMIQVIDSLEENLVEFGVHASATSGRVWVPVWRKLFAEHDVKLGHFGGRVFEFYPSSKAHVNRLQFDLGFHTGSSNSYRYIEVSDDAKFELLDSIIDISPDPVVMPGPAPDCNHADISTLLNLPVEIWMSILELTRAPLRTLIALSGTCQFYRKLFSNPCFYRKIDLNEVLLPSDALVTFLAERCSGVVRHLIMPTSPYSANYLPHAKLLEQLDTETLRVLIADQCSGLNRNSLGRLFTNQPNIQQIRISDCCSLSSSGFRHMLSLQHIRCLSLKHAAIDIGVLTQFIKESRHLHTLELVEMNLLTVEDDFAAELDALSTSIRDMRALSLDFTINGVLNDRETVESASFWRNVLTGNPDLEEFYLRDSFHIDINAETLNLVLEELNPTLRELCPKLRRLSRFVFTGDRNTGLTFSSLARHLSGLVCLDSLSFLFISSPFTESDLASFVTLMPWLRYLTIVTDELSISSDCEKMTANLRSSHPKCRVKFIGKYSYADDYKPKCSCDMGKLRCPYQSHFPEFWIPPPPTAIQSLETSPKRRYTLRSRIVNANCDC